MKNFSLKMTEQHNSVEIRDIYKKPFKNGDVNNQNFFKIRRLNVIKTSVLPKLNYRFNAISAEICTVFCRS